MQHLEEGTIHAWLDGALPGDEAERVEQHARECAECAAMVADARGLIAGAARIVSALDIVPGGVIPKKAAAAPASRPLWRMLRLSPFRAAMAASLMVAAASVFVILPRGDKISVPEAAFARVDSAAPAGTQPAAVPPSPAPVPPAPVVAAASSDLSSSSLRKRAQASPEARSELAAQAQAGQQAQQGQQRPAAKDEPNMQQRRVVDASRAVLDSVRPVAAERDRRQDSLVAKVAAAPPAAGGGRGGRALGAANVTTADQAARTVPMSRLAESGFAPAGFAGCYRVVVDSTWPRGLPTRFALTSETTSTGGRVRNLVRGLDAAGRIDTTTIGDWQSMGVSSATVLLNNASTQIAFSLRSGPPVVMTQLGARTIGAAPVERTGCVR